jgi:hypothetical protein
MKTLIVFILCVLLSATVSYGQMTVIIKKIDKSFEITRKTKNSMDITKISISGGGSLKGIPITRGNHLMFLSKKHMLQINQNNILLDGISHGVIGSNFKSMTINLPDPTTEKQPEIDIDKLIFDKDGTMIIKQ